MSRFIDFPTVYGKIGNHPGLLTHEQAIALFDQAMACPPKSDIVEYWPDGGRSTIVLSHAARNLDGQLYVVTDWSKVPDQARGWFDRAVLTHKLAQVTTIDPIALPPTPALMVVRGQYRPSVSGKVLVLGDIAQLNGYLPTVHGPGWAVIDYIVPTQEPSDVLDEKIPERKVRPRLVSSAKTQQG